MVRFYILVYSDITENLPMLKTSQILITEFIRFDD